jgi:gas vesicle protein
MGETVDAIGAKTDVKGRMSGYVSDKKGAVLARTDAVVSRVTGSVPDAEGTKETARRVGGMAQENPIGLALAGAAVGFLAGVLVPSTSMENERMGSVADELKDRARETGHEALERGKHVAYEAGRAAAETARDEGRSEREELASTLKESAQEMRSGGS